MKVYMPFTFVVNDIEQVVALTSITEIAAKHRPVVSIPDRYTRTSGQAAHLPAERFANVLKKCSALQTLVEQAKTSQLGHDAGFALVWIALQFEGAMNWIQQNMVGWAQTESDQQQILNSNHYAPLSCESMQQRGLCKFTRPDVCLKRKAVGGNLVSPSPIRFAYRSENQQQLLNEILVNLQGD